MGSNWIGFAAGLAAGPFIYYTFKTFVTSRPVALDSNRRGEPLKVVVTGSSKGLGYALAHAFLQAGDSVVINSRDAKRCEDAVSRLNEDFPAASVCCCAADVGIAEQADKLADFAMSKFGRVDIWVNNAGVSQPVKGSIVDADATTISQIVSTNLLGSIFGSRAAMRAMQMQSSPGGKVFLMDGQGASGSPTPNNATYGATKAALVQLKASLAAQVRGTTVAVHIASPGMVATDLLGASMRGAGSSRRAARVLNVLAEDPNTVARWLVPRMRGIKGNGRYFRYLTPLSAVWKLATRWRSNKGRFYPD